MGSGSFTDNFKRDAVAQIPARGRLIDAEPSDDGCRPAGPAHGRLATQRCLFHSDPGSQFTNTDWAAFLRTHDLEHPMGRHGNYHDNAVAESFLNLLQRVGIRHRTCPRRNERVMGRFNWSRKAQMPLSQHDQATAPFRPKCHRLSAIPYCHAGAHAVSNGKDMAEGLAVSVETYRRSTAGESNLTMPVGPYGKLAERGRVRLAPGIGSTPVSPKVRDCRLKVVRRPDGICRSNPPASGNR